MKVGLIARFWNAVDLVGPWLEAHVPHVDCTVLMDCGSSDGTFARLQAAAQVYGSPLGWVEVYGLPPTAPMRSALWMNMLLERLRQLEVDVVLALDHDEFLEPEFWTLLPLLLAQEQATWWELPRANFQFSDTYYSRASGDCHFRERVMFRLQPGHYYPDVDARAPGGVSCHHLERVPVGGVERPAGDARTPPPDPAYAGRTLGLVLQHHSQRSPSRSAAWQARLADGAAEAHPGLTVAPEEVWAALRAQGRLGEWESYTQWVWEATDRGWGIVADHLTPAERAQVRALLQEGREQA